MFCSSQNIKTGSRPHGCLEPLLAAQPPQRYKDWSLEHCHASYKTSKQFSYTPSRKTCNRQRFMETFYYFMDLSYCIFFTSFFFLKHTNQLTLAQYFLLIISIIRIEIIMTIITKRRVFCFSFSLSISSSQLKTRHKTLQ